MSSTTPLPDVAIDEEVLLAEARQLFDDDPAAWEQVERAAEGITDDDDQAQRRKRAQARLAKLRELLHTRIEDNIPTALCLSGGGIRSATFSLGVVQGLAERHLLPKFHYLSSVSGGGYLASWLSAWIRNESLRLQAGAPLVASEVAATQEQSAEVARQQKSGSSAPTDHDIDARQFAKAQEEVFAQLGRVGHGQAEEPLPLRKLRAYSSYLSPMRGISADALTLLAIYTRNLTLNWMVLIPALLAALLLPRLHLSFMHGPIAPWWLADAMSLAALLLVGWTIAYMASDLPAAPGDETPARQRVDLPAPRRSESVFLPLALPLAAAAALITWLIAWHARNAYPLPFLAELFLPAEDACLYRLLRAIPWPQWLSLLHPRDVHGLLIAGVSGGVVQALCSWIGGTALRQYRNVESGVRPADTSAVRAVFVSGCLTGMGLFLMVHGLLDLARDRDNADFLLLATLSVPALMWLFWLGVTLYAGWRRPIGHEDEREWFARAASHWIAGSIYWLAIFGLVLYLPTALLSWTGLKGGAATVALGAGTGAMGALIAMIGYLSKHGPAWLHRAETVAEKTGMRLLDLASIVFILLLLCGLSFLVTLAMRADQELLHRQDQSLYARVLAPANEAMVCAAQAAADKGATPRLGTPCNPTPCVDHHCAHWTDMSIHRYAQSLTTVEPWPLLLALAGLLALSLGLSRRFGVNAFSLHSMYGNRLVRAYLAASRLYAERRPHWFTGFDPKDNVPMHELWPARVDRDRPPRLFHVVNIALNIVKPSGRRLEWQDRKATSFTVSPLFSGSAETGYVPSRHYVESPHRSGISLGCAMTISGAAASPNMGYHSSMPLAFVMTLFNLRLGLWMPNPAWPRLSGEIGMRWPWRRDEPTLGLAALLNEAMGNTTDESQFLNLSDGGHFDNMGLYEMVRRRCRRIVLVDATADPDYVHADLMNTLRKIRVDMGIEISFPAGLPGPVEKGRSGHAIAVGVIRYAGADGDAPAGALVLIKPCLPQDGLGPDAEQLPLDVRRYAVESARDDERFPQQPTSDQFFDETQFESYRMLGLYLTRTGFHDGDLTPRLPPDRGGPPPAPPMPDGARGAAIPAEGLSDAGSIPASRSIVEGATAMGKQFKDSLGVIAATAVVSAVTVTGAVKLTDNKVEISNPELRLAPGSGTGRLETQALQQSVDAAASAAAQLSDAVASLSDKAASAAEPVAGMATRASEAASAVEAFGKSLKGGGGSGDGKPGADGKPGKSGIVSLDANDAKKLVDAASAAQKAAESASTAATSARDASVNMSRYLQDIRDRIAQTPPRSNARGGNGDR